MQTKIDWKKRVRKLNDRQKSNEPEKDSTMNNPTLDKPVRWKDPFEDPVEMGPGYVFPKRDTESDPSIATNSRQARVFTHQTNCNKKESPWVLDVSSKKIKKVMNKFSRVQEIKDLLRNKMSKYKEGEGLVLLTDLGSIPVRVSKVIGYGKYDVTSGSQVISSVKEEQLIRDNCSLSTNNS